MRFIHHGRAVSMSKRFTPLNMRPIIGPPDRVRWAQASKCEEAAVFRPLPSFIVIALILIASMPSPAQERPAQGGVEPQIVTMISSAEQVYTAIDQIMRLTGPVDGKQTQVIKNYLDVFLIGMDRQAPMRMDALVDKGPFRYRSAFPVPPQQMKNFRDDNLAPLGIQNRRVGVTLYKLGGKVFQGWMRYDDEYAWFAEQQNDLGKPPEYMPPPDVALRTLQGKRYLFGGELINGANGVDERHQMLSKPGGFRERWLTGLKPRKDESESDFELRKLTLEHRLDELQQYVAEASHGEFGGHLDERGKSARFDLMLTPIQGTPLADNIAQLGKNPSDFAAIERKDQSALSLRVNYPLDAMRQENAVETLRMMRRRRDERIDESDTRNAQQKQKAKQAADVMFNVLESTVKSGLVDTFAEMWQRESGNHTLVAGLRTVDGTELLDAIKLLPETDEGQEVELEIEKVGDVAIHSVLLASEGERPAIGEIFGSYRGYVGTSKDAVWFAAGEDALDALKAAIEQVDSAEDPAPDPVFFKLDTRLDPIVKLTQNPTDDQMPTALSKYRRIAEEAFEPGDDRLEVRFEKVGNDLRGLAQASAGILRFIGKAAAEFSRENLDEEGNRRQERQAAR